MLNKIVKWAKNELPLWQSDAVRRILTQDELDENDIAELTLMLKERHNLVDSKITVPKPQPLLLDHIHDASQDRKVMRLKSMTVGCDVNAIPDGSVLPFAHEGITVVYGENGSGKSGYARVLKKACYARDTKDSILPNAFMPTCSGKASAEFKVSINDGEDKTIDWIDGQQEPSVMSNICFFDSKCARVIVDENNQVTYLPYGAIVFENLASVLATIKSKIEIEIPYPKNSILDSLSKTTEAFMFVSKLNNNTKVKEIDEFCKWEKKDEDRLRTINKKISDAEASDVANQIKRLRNLKNRIIYLIDSILIAEKLISKEKCDSLNKKISELNTAKKVHEVVAQEKLSDEPLPGAGEDVWQKLYLAAKQYSIERAYPNKDFPLVTNSSLCVFCMQPLTDSAKKRMNRFKKFMEDTSQKAFEKAQSDVEKAKIYLESFKIADPEEFQDAIDEIENRSVLNSIDIKKFLDNTKLEVKGMLNAIIGNKIVKFNPFEEVYIDCASEIAEGLEAEAKYLENTNDPKILLGLKKEKNELTDKKQIHNKIEDIKKYILERKKQKKYEKCLLETKTVKIINKGKKIIKEALTPELIESLKKELDYFGISHFSINLIPMGKSGETLHKMALSECQPFFKAKLSEVLSEGEQHVLAMSGFLAELKLTNNISPIVFDDPVCSLDHLFRAKIAHRLAHEATNRQVIVFTHDISFLLDLNTACNEIVNSTFYSSTLCRIGKMPGVCTSGLPWHAMHIKERIKFLNRKIDELFALSKDNGSDYDEKAGIVYGFLREAWEASIEDVIFYGTIKRHDSTIQTKRLNYVAVSDEDCRTIDTEMSKCSKWMIGHDKSAAIDCKRPSPDIIREDIKILSEFVKAI